MVDVYPSMTSGISRCEQNTSFGANDNEVHDPDSCLDNFHSLLIEFCSK